MKVAVVTDSAAALPADLAARYDIRVVPLVLHVGADRYRDGEISLDEMDPADGGRINVADLEAWLRDPPGEKPMDPVTPEQVEAGEQGRGMPNLNLSEEQIDQLVAFLATLE